MNAVRNKTIGEEDGVELKKILSADIHPAIKAYFKAEVEKNLLLERSMEYRSKKFPYSLPEVVSLQRQIDLLLVLRYHFDHQEFESLLDESVHFQFNYLCRPQWTLLNFIGGEKRHVAASEIEKKLHYCVDYTYFPELIKRYLVDHGLADLTFEEFKELIEKIDREVVAQHSSLELAKMTRALFAFVESGKMSPRQEFEHQTLPINAAVVFFEDKQLLDVQSRLEFERDKNEVSQLTVEQLAQIIEIIRTGNENTPVVEPEGTIAEVTEQIKTSAPEISAVEMPKPISANFISAVTPVMDQSPESISLLQPVEEKEKEKSLPSAAESRTPVLVFGENDEQYLTDSPGMKQKEICDLFTDDEHELIVRKIFNRDEPAFLGAVMEISLQKSWEEVAHYLDALYIVNDVDPFGNEAVLFTDRLFVHYHVAKRQ
ncbi:MAG TPA: hypothetical protein VMU30_07160 [Bacteroidota bacterium]|nr:hypothetical protein [Bacteroidota bacterium]